MTIKRLLAFLSLAILSTSAFASITDVPATDKSYELLRYLFGSVVDVITGGTGPVAPDHIIGAMSEVLNAGMLIFTGLIAGYVFVTGVLNSANEGTTLGKSYNTMWIPLRMVFALSLVLPFAGGYSAMQVGVIWMGGKGIGLADTTWNAALDYMGSTGALYPPPITDRSEELALSYLTSRVCLHGTNAADRWQNVIDKAFVARFIGSDATMNDVGESAELKVAGSLDIGQVYGGTKSLLDTTLDRFAQRAILFANGVPRYYEPSACGYVRYEFKALDPDTGLDSIITLYRQDVIKTASDLDVSMDALAKSIIEHSLDPTSPAPDKNAFKLNTDIYRAANLVNIQTVMAAIAQHRIDRFAPGNGDLAGNNMGAREAGWLSAGAYYWDLQKLNAETQELFKVQPKTKPPEKIMLNSADFQIFAKALVEYNKTRTVLNKYNVLTSKIDESAYDEGDFDNYIILGVLRASIETVLYSPDPITGLQNAGNYMITAMEAALLPLLVLSTAADAVDSGVDTAGGVVAGVLRGASKTTLLLLQKSLGFLFALIFLITPIALLLAFYLPATPLILWVLGVAGWFILLIEAVIAAPIWAASHAMPEGEGFVGQRAMAGYMVLLSLFLRPTLMLFGFFCSMTLMIVMGKVIVMLFVPFISSMTSQYLIGIVTFFASLGILTTLLIQVSHRCYGLIHEIPDKVLRYIGGGAENLGESSGEQSNKSSFSAGTAATVNAASGLAKKNEKRPGGGGGGGGGGEKGSGSEAAQAAAATKSKAETNKNLT
jgi:conjugal transfer/type IV secretion protein DotA/TraY